VVWTTTFVAFTSFYFPFSLTFGFILLILTVAFAILEFTKFLWMVVRPINLLFTLYILHYSEPLTEDRIQRNVGDDFLK
jgi:NO-binding membrane sensor protein with MHYT domain